MTATQTRRKPTRRTPPAEDRFRDRRRAAARRTGAKRLRLVVGLTVVSTLAIATIGFLNSAGFDVDRVTVTGTANADPHAVAEASGVLVGQPLLDVDPDAAARAVETVPWVRTADIRRGWGGDVEIVVTERTPALVIPVTGGVGYVVVDETGRQLAAVDRRPVGEMPVVGVAASGIAGEDAAPITPAVVALLDAVPAEVRSGLERLVVRDGELSFDLVQGGAVDLGRPEELDAKLQAMETMLDRVDLRCLATLDVRVPSAPVVTRTAPLDDGEDGAETADGGGVPDSTTPDC